MEIKICYIMIYIIEAFILWQYCSNLFKTRYAKWVEGVLFTMFYVVLFIISCFDELWVNVIAFIFINLIIIRVLFQIEWSAALFHTFIIIIVMGLSELLVIDINKYFIKDLYESSTSFHRVIILSVFSKLISFLVLQMIIRKADKQKKLYSKTFGSSVALVGMPITSAWIMLTLFSISLHVKLSLPFGWMISTSTIILLLINLLIFWVYSYAQKTGFEFMELQMQLQKENDMAEYYKHLLKQDENQKIIIHDIRKHLESIEILNRQGEREKVTAYINRIINTSDLKEMVRFCDNELLNAVLSCYMSRCIEQNILFRVDIRKNCVDCLEDNDLTALFCNLLDNAVASAGSQLDSYIEFSAVNKENTDITLITIINSCKKNPYLLNKRTLTTSKSDKRHHGFGMKSVYRIVKKYNGDMQTYYDEKSRTFHTIILIKKVLA